MRVPSKREKQYGSRLLHLASQDDDRQEMLWQIILQMQNISENEPFLKPSELRQKTIKAIIDQGYDDIETTRMYDAAIHQAIPFFSTGEKLVQGDKQLDEIARIARKELYQQSFDKEGNPLGKRFDSNVANVVIKAVKSKLDILTKMQANVIAAQNKNQRHELGDDFRIEDADREQLLKLVDGDLIDHPDLVAKLMNQKQEQEIPAFYEVIDHG